MTNLNYKSGDYIRLRLALKEIEGTVLESSSSEILLLKLNSGYNIGINKENILAGRILKRFKGEESGKLRLETREGLPSIGMIITGGTIASKIDPKTGGVKPLINIEEFAEFYPEIFKIVNIAKLEVPFMIDSSLMDSSHWRKIAEIAEKMLNNTSISGVIITHGTDTLHYTSSALSFFLRKLNKPVVLTFSQRSIDRASSDANLNLQCAARMTISDCAEVMIVGHATTNDDFCYAMRGTKVRKLHSSRRDAFKTINEKPIAKVFSDKVEFLSKYRPRNNEKVELDIDFSDKVALIKYYPGQNSDILDYYALKYKGIIIEALGLGQLPNAETENNWIIKLKKHIREGMVVCITSQTIFGKVDGYVYHNARELTNAGVIFLEDMLSETALIKLSWILGHHGWKIHVKEKMLENLAGELSDRLGID